MCGVSDGTWRGGTLAELHSFRGLLSKEQSYSNTQSFPVLISVARLGGESTEVIPLEGLDSGRGPDGLSGTCQGFLGYHFPIRSPKNTITVSW